MTELRCSFIYSFFVFAACTSQPEGQPGKKAENLADSMLKALNYEQFQAASEISWTFAGKHHYRWNKTENRVQVQWEDYTVQLDPETKSGTARQADTELQGSALKEAIQTAWEYYANDSFWIFAPFKVRDPGTSRGFVQLEEGKGLLVHYQSGGVTPGDSYLWVLDDSFRPKYWRMWVDIVPVPGLKFSWENWQEYNGVWIAGNHDGLIDVPITNVNIKLATAQQ